MVDVYADEEIAAEIPAALARSQQALHARDPRRLPSEALTRMALGQQRAFLRRAIEDCVRRDGPPARAAAQLPQHHPDARRCASPCWSALTILIVRANPTYMPLCFPANGDGTEGSALNCPTGTDVTANRGSDIVVVALLGLLGGALAAAVSIRNLRGTSTPYDVPVALALLKVPLGAFTAILGLVALQGSFVPGLSALDSQQQILAYALVLGYAQQVFTYSLDRKAQTLLDGLPAKDPTVAPSAWTRLPVPPSRRRRTRPGPARFVDGARSGPRAARRRRSTCRDDRPDRRAESSPPRRRRRRRAGRRQPPDAQRPDRGPPLMRTYPQAKEFAQQQHRSRVELLAQPLPDVLPAVRRRGTVRRVGPRGVQRDPGRGPAPVQPAAARVRSPTTASRTTAPGTPCSRCNGGFVWSNDILRRGRIDRVRWDVFQNRWRLPYRGWISAARRRAARAAAGRRNDLPGYRQGRKVYASKMRLEQDDSDSVWNLQVALIARGFEFENGPTGYYGRHTRRCVAAFQRRRGWTGRGRGRHRRSADDRPARPGLGRRMSQHRRRPRRPPQPTSTSCARRRGAGTACSWRCSASSACAAPCTAAPRAPSRAGFSSSPPFSSSPLSQSPASRPCSSPARRGRWAGGAGPRRRPTSS